jgi:hypothetical protein
MVERRKRRERVPSRVPAKNPSEIVARHQAPVMVWWISEAGKRTMRFEVTQRSR